MVFIIIKTLKSLESELISIHKSKEDASYHLNKLSDPELINRIVNDKILKVYENNYIMTNKSLHLYQIIEVKENEEDNNYGGYN